MKLIYLQGTTKFIFMALLLLVAVLASIYANTGYIQQATDYIEENFLSKKSNGELVSYYQWTSASGEVVISREKPSHTNDFISFQASSDLISNDNNVDQNLISQSNRYRDQVLAEEKNSPKTNTESRSTSKTKSATDGTVFSAPAKVKHCVNAALQQGAANRQAAESGAKANRSSRC